LSGCPRAGTIEEGSPPWAAPPALAEVLAKAWAVRQAHFPPVLGVDRPSLTVPVSVTGTGCALDCAHCGRHYLRSMRPAVAVPVPGVRSYLVSGGCDSRGRVPLTAHRELLARLRETGAHLNLHTGLVGEVEAEQLAVYGQVVSLDWVTDEATVKEVYGLEAGAADYEAAYRALASHLPVVPHLCIGLKGGEMEGEWEALERLSRLRPQAVVFIVFIPTPGTRYASRAAPPVAQVVEFLAQARLQLPEAELSLGCMRPRGEYRRRLDPLAVAAGINRIVLPAPEAIEEARARGLVLSASEECCALALVDHEGEGRR